MRAQVTEARQVLARAAMLPAWAALYLPLTVWWWPASLVSAVLFPAGRARIRAAADTYAVLLEATVRLHARDLADRLGLTAAGPLTPDIGEGLARHLSSTPPPPPPV